MRTCVYVDGESHFARSEWLWKQCHVNAAELSHIVSIGLVPGGLAYPDPDEPYVCLEARAKFFWDKRYPYLAPNPFREHPIDNAVYFTAVSGDDTICQDVRVSIRKHRFDPQVTKEPKELADQRKNRLRNYGIIEKAKGVDIALSVRVLEDAYHNIYDSCYLFTSDIDFLPVIRVLQRIGKKVIVFGYMDGIGARSELEYVPDAFVDLSAHMRSHYQYEIPSTAQG
jgi:uncharacterized LabA/DUF88 family protein